MLAFTFVCANGNLWSILSGVNILIPFSGLIGENNQLLKLLFENILFNISKLFDSSEIYFR